jgi:hypothetical protein
MALDSLYPVMTSTMDMPPEMPRSMVATDKLIRDAAEKLDFTDIFTVEEPKAEVCAYMHIFICLCKYLYAYICIQM